MTTERDSSLAFVEQANRHKALLRNPRFLVTGLAFIGGLALLGTLFRTDASSEFIALIIVIVGFCGIILFDIISRRKWENQITEQFIKLSQNHDRLVRETARNRNEVAALKDGLSRTASNMEAQGRRHTPSSSIEAKMIEMIIAQLSTIGGTPRAQINAGPDRHILQLEMFPPLNDLDPDLAHDFKLHDPELLDIIRDAVRHDTIEIFMQPVVSLPQRKVRLYEIYARINSPAGASLPAQRYLDVAKKDQLVSAIDNLLLLRCLQLLRNQGMEQTDTPFILNIAAATLHDRGFMGDLVTFLSEHRSMARHLIFELTQTDFESLDSSLIPVLDGLSRLGCRFSMDCIYQRTLDIGMMKKRHIRFIKLDAAWLLRESSARHGFNRIAELKKELDAAGIDLIVEKIEQESFLPTLLDFNIDYGQGYLFGKPDSADAWLSKEAAE